jgi:hypothetical protein
MSTELFLAFHTLEDLRAFLDRNCSGDTLLLPRPEGDGNPAQFAPLTLRVALPDQQLSQEGQVLQLLPDGQLVVGLGEPAVLVPAVAQVAASASAAPPLVSWTELTFPATAEDDTPAMTTGPEYWPQEKLQAEWNALTVAQRIVVARRGKLGARRMILKGQDHKLHQFVLTNPHITSGEVAAMAGMTSLAPDLLKRIATQPEWLRHGQVVRNLVCNPKLPLDVVSRLLHKMPDRELRQLARGGRVRQAVKRMIIKKVSGSR